MKIKFTNKELDLSAPAIMGIVNVTPDSFYDGGKYATEEALLQQCNKMIQEGADILDIGGYSTRSQAVSVSEEEELKRSIPAIQTIRKHFPKAIISIDTFRPKVAMEAVNTGADLINDISGGGFSLSEKDKFFQTIASLNVPYILMHIQGTPETMQQNPHYENIMVELKIFFSEKIKRAKQAGIKQIIIDPGFGFGKNLEHNYTILKELFKLKDFNLPILAGVSRKSMINKITNNTPATALNGTTIVNTIALMNGADILRVHDVKEAKEAVKIVNFIKNLK